VLLTSFDPFVTDFDRLVQRTFGRTDGSAAGPVLGYTAACRWTSSGATARLCSSSTCPVPTPTASRVSTDRRVLTVAAKRTEEYAEQERPVVRERITGSFARKVRLAEPIDAEKVHAQYENGVLTVVLPVARAGQGAQDRDQAAGRPGAHLPDSRNGYAPGPG